MTIIEILHDHGIKIKESCGRLLAFDIVYYPGGADCSEWIDVTDWPLSKIRMWLGY